MIRQQHVDGGLAVHLILAGDNLKATLSQGNALGQGTDAHLGDIADHLHTVAASLGRAQQFVVVHHAVGIGIELLLNVAIGLAVERTAVDALVEHVLLLREPVATGGQRGVTNEAGALIVWVLLGEAAVAQGMHDTTDGWHHLLVDLLLRHKLHLVAVGIAQRHAVGTTEHGKRQDVEKMAIGKPHGVLVVLGANDARRRALRWLTPTEVKALLEAVEALDGGYHTWHRAGIELFAARTEECSCTLRQRLCHSPDARTQHAVGLTKAAGGHHSQIPGSSIENLLLDPIHIYIAGFLHSFWGFWLPLRCSGLLQRTRKGYFKGLPRPSRRSPFGCRGRRRRWRAAIRR